MTSFSSLSSDDLDIGRFGYGFDDITSSAGNVLNEFRDLKNINFDIDNYAELDLSSSYNSSFVIVQNSPGTSWGNKAKLVQRGSDNHTEINQSGYLNTALVIQEGANNTTSVTQHGVGVQSLVAQIGDNNEAILDQSGLFYSKVSVAQTGYDNRAHISGHGYMNVGLHQDGGDTTTVHAARNMSIQINHSGSN